MEELKHVVVNGMRICGVIKFHGSYSFYENVATESEVVGSFFGPMEQVIVSLCLNFLGRKVSNLMKVFVVRNE